MNESNQVKSLNFFWLKVGFKQLYMLSMCLDMRSKFEQKKKVLQKLKKILQKEKEKISHHFLSTNGMQRKFDYLFFIAIFKAKKKKKSQEKNFSASKRRTFFSDARIEKNLNWYFEEWIFRTIYFFCLRTLNIAFSEVFSFFEHTKILCFWCFQNKKRLYHLIIPSDYI